MVRTLFWTILARPFHQTTYDNNTDDGQTKSQIQKNGQRDRSLVGQLFFNLDG